MAAAEDYYVLLGIDTSADAGELRRAWRRLALEWHPDRAGAAATATFQKLAVAYEVLSDAAARAAYDRWRGIPSRSPPIESPPAPPRRAPGVLLSRLSGPLNALLARRVARYAEGELIDLVLEPDEASEGGMVTISMRVPVRCPTCAAEPTAACPRCHGERQIEDLFAAWLAVRPGVANGTILTPSSWLPGMIHPVYFRVRLAPA